MEGGPARELLELLVRRKEGDATALPRLVELVEPELRRMARARLTGLRATLRNFDVEPSLDSMGLVSELYIRMLAQEGSFNDRAHFFATAALRMRAICVDHARRALSRKRRASRDGSAVHGSGRAPRARAAAGAVLAVQVERSVEVLALEQALARLETLYPRQARIVALRHYGGLTDPEIAEVTSVSEATVRRDWRMARAFLFRELAGTQA